MIFKNLLEFAKRLFQDIRVQLMRKKMNGKVRQFLSEYADITELGDRILNYLKEKKNIHK